MSTSFQLLDVASGARVDAAAVVVFMMDAGSPGWVRLRFPEKFGVVRNPERERPTKERCKIAMKRHKDHLAVEHGKTIRSTPP